MMLSVHQPVYLPGLILFNKIALSDGFVVLGHVPLTRTSWQTRNRIRVETGEHWLSVPVLTTGRFGQSINDTEIAPRPWARTHLRTIAQSYGRRPWFSTVFPVLEAVLNRPWNRLADLNTELLRTLLSLLGITTPIYDSRDVEPSGHKTDLLIGICRRLGAERYLSNEGARAYIDEEAMARAGIQHCWQRFEHPVYSQGAPFLADLSVVDLLFNVGPEAAGAIVRGCGRIEPGAFAPGPGLAPQTPDQGLVLNLPKTQGSLEAGRAAMARRFPALIDALNAATPESVAVQDASGAVVDIDIGATRLYRDDARTLARRQVDDFMAAPTRYVRTTVAGNNSAYGVGRRLSDFMIAACHDLGITDECLSLAPEYEGGVLIVLGVGLGYHIPELVRRTRARTVILYEPFVEFFHHAMAALDWEAFLTESEAAGREISLVWTREAEEAIRVIRWRLEKVAKPFIDGTYVFAHYPAEAVVRTRDGLGGCFDVLSQVFGFFEDELRMFTNTVANLKRQRFRLLEAKPMVRRREPVFVIAAGPSLDRDLEEIKRRREGVLVISCGTALRALLRAGIVPDFHCENESIPDTFEAYDETRRAYAFTGITLITALTVDPRSYVLFDEGWAYFREHVTPTLLFTTPDRVLANSTPNVANAAMRAAVAMGFAAITLFGVDLGVRTGGRIHAEGTVYDHIPSFGDYEQSLSFGYTLPGNFGGMVETDVNFNHARLQLEALISQSRIEVVNCSDGLHIAGATAQPAAALPPLRRRLDRARIKQQIAANFTGYAPGGYPFQPALEAATVAAEGGFAGLIEAIDRAGQGHDFVAFFHAVAPFADERVHGGVQRFVAGSLISMYKIAAFFLMRVRDDVQRQALFQRFVGEYRAIVLEMRDQCLAVLRAAAEPEG